MPSYHQQNSEKPSRDLSKSAKDYQKKFNIRIKDLSDKEKAMDIRDLCKSIIEKKKKNPVEEVERSFKLVRKHSDSKKDARSQSRLVYLEAVKEINSIFEENIKDYLIMAEQYCQGHKERSSDELQWPIRESISIRCFPQSAIISDDAKKLSTTATTSSPSYQKAFKGYHFVSEPMQVHTTHGATEHPFRVLQRQFMKKGIAVVLDRNFLQVFKVSKAGGNQYYSYLKEYQHFQNRTKEGFDQLETSLFF